MIEVITETGRSYLIHEDFWKRLAKPGEYQMGWEKVWSLMRGTEFSMPTKDSTTWEDGEPEVGKYMFIGNRSQWYVSTKVVSIEEVDDDF